MERRFGRLHHNPIRLAGCVLGRKIPRVRVARLPIGWLIAKFVRIAIYCRIGIVGSRKVDARAQQVRVRHARIRVTIASPAKGADIIYLTVRRTKFFPSRGVCRRFILPNFKCGFLFHSTIPQMRVVNAYFQHRVVAVACNRVRRALRQNRRLQ